jgi:hypothetical protein
MTAITGRALRNDRDVPDARWDLLVAAGAAVGLCCLMRLDTAKLGRFARERISNEL